MAEEGEAAVHDGVPVTVVAWRGPGEARTRRGVGGKEEEETTGGLCKTLADIALSETLEQLVATWCWYSSCSSRILTGVQGTTKMVP